MTITYQILRRSTQQIILAAGLLWLASQKGSADGLDHWQFRNPLPSDISLQSIAYGNGMFVAIGDWGGMQVSSDGVSWSVLEPIATNMLNSIIFANNRFVAVGDGGTILSSPDGLNWTRQSSGTATRLLAIAQGGSFYLATGANGTLLRSANASLWTPVSAPGVTNDLGWVTYGNGKFVIPSGTDRIILSPDGASWSQPLAISNASPVLQVAAGNGIFVAYASHFNFQVFRYEDFFYVSSDGTNWSIGTAATTAWQYPITFHLHLAFLNGQFVELGGGATSAADFSGVNFSSDGRNWTQARFPYAYSLRDIAFGGGRYVTVGVGGILITSTNATNWTLGTTGCRNSLVGIAAGAGVVVAASSASTRCVAGPPLENSAETIPSTNASILVSLDGTHFDVAVSATTQPQAAVVYGGGVFMSAGAGGTLQASTNGLQWFLRNSGTTSALNALCYGSNLWVAVGAGGTVATSSSGLAWTLRWAGTAYALNGIARGNGLFVAVGTNGTIITSPDAFNWTVQYSGVSTTLFGVTYANGMFVAVGDAGAILTSADGENWLSRFSGTSARLNAIAFGQGQFLAVGGSSWQNSVCEDSTRALLRSYDAATWESIEASCPHKWSLSAVTLINGHFWIGGGLGGILQSDAVAAELMLQPRALPTPGQIELAMFGVVPPVGRIQARTNAFVGAWQDLNWFTNGHSGMTWTDTNAAAFSSRYYRVVAP
jgi:hypothetical protein